MNKVEKTLMKLIIFLNIVFIPQISYCTESGVQENSIIKYFLIGVGLIFIAFILFIAYKLDNTVSKSPMTKVKKEKNKNVKNAEYDVDDQVIEEDDESIEEVVEEEEVEQNITENDDIDYTEDIKKFEEFDEYSNEQFKENNVESVTIETPDTFIEQLKNFVEPEESSFTFTTAENINNEEIPEEKILNEENDENETNDFLSQMEANIAKVEEKKKTKKSSEKDASKKKTATKRKTTTKELEKNKTDKKTPTNKKTTKKTTEKDSGEKKTTRKTTSKSTTKKTTKKSEK